MCSRRRVCARLRAQERVRIFSYAFGVDAVFSDVQVGCKKDATLRAGCNLVCNSRSQRCTNNTPRWAKATLQRPRCVALFAVVCLFVCFVWQAISCGNGGVAKRVAIQSH
jgi:hypothetical protein